MKNSSNEAKRLWLETSHYKGLIDYVAMDSKADDYDLYCEFRRQRKIKLMTFFRQNMDKGEKRRQMTIDIHQPQHQQVHKERGYCLKPMQGLVKGISDLNPCWIKGKISNR